MPACAPLEMSRDFLANSLSNVIDVPQTVHALINLPRIAP
jgi:hypothetical protein